MWIIFGWIPQTRKRGQYFRECSTCNRQTSHSIETRRTWFTLFFLPVIPLGASHKVERCNLCGLEWIDGQASSRRLSKVGPQLPPLETLPALREDEAVVRLTWPGMLFLFDTKFTVTFDGKLLDKVSIVNPYFKDIRTSPGSHVLELKVPIRRPKRYDITCPYSGYYSVVLEYSRTWGNFLDTCQFQSVPQSLTASSVSPANFETKKCPQCAETIKLEAILCRYCGHHFSEEEVKRASRKRAEEERKKATAAIEAEKKRVLMESQRAAAALKAFRQRKARYRRTIAWILIVASCLLFLSWVGGVVDLAKDWTVSQFIGALAMALVILVAIPVIPALLLLRSAKRLSQGKVTKPNAEQITGANAG